MLNNKILKDIERAKTTGQVLPEGGYVCHIVDVNEIDDDIYIMLDISEGKYKYYFSSVGSSFHEYIGGIIYDYPTLCYELNNNDFSERLKLAHFIKMAEKSNPDFKFNGNNLNEIKNIGIVLEYTKAYPNSGIMTFKITSIETPDYIRSHYNSEEE